MSGKSNGRTTREGDQLLQMQSDSDVDSEVQEFAMKTLQPKRAPVRRRPRSRQRSSGGCKSCIRGCFFIFFVALIGAVGYLGYTVWKMQHEISRLDKKVNELTGKAALTASLKATQVNDGHHIIQLQQQVDNHHHTLVSHNQSLLSIGSLRHKLNELSGTVTSSDVEKKIKGVEEKVAGLNRAIADANQGMAQFHSDLEGVQNKLEEMQRAVGVASPNSPGLSARVEAMVRNHSNTAKDVESLQARVSGIKSLLDSNGIQLSAIEHRVQPLEDRSEQQLAMTKQHHENISAVQMKLERLQSQIDQLTLTAANSKETEAAVVRSGKDLIRVNETLRNLIAKVTRGVLHSRRNTQAKLTNISQVVTIAMHHINDLSNVMVEINHTVTSRRFAFMMQTPGSLAQTSPEDVPTPVSSAPPTSELADSERKSASTTTAMADMKQQLQHLWANWTRSQEQLHKMDGRMTRTMTAMEADLHALNASMVQHRHSTLQRFTGLEHSTSQRFTSLEHRIVISNKSLPLAFVNANTQPSMNVSELLNTALAKMSSPDTLKHIASNLAGMLQHVNLTALLAGVDWAGALDKMVNASMSPPAYWKKVMKVTDEETIKRTRHLQVQSVHWLQQYMRLMLATNADDRRRLGKAVTALSADIFNDTVEVLNGLEHSKGMVGASSIQILSDEKNRAATADRQKSSEGKTAGSEDKGQAGSDSLSSEKQRLGKKSDGGEVSRTKENHGGEATNEKTPGHKKQGEVSEESRDKQTVEEERNDNRMQEDNNEESHGERLDNEERNDNRMQEDNNEESHGEQLGEEERKDNQMQEDNNEESHGEQSDEEQRNDNRMQEENNEESHGEQLDGEDRNDKQLQAKNNEESPGEEIANEEKDDNQGQEENVAESGGEQTPNRDVGDDRIPEENSEENPGEQTVREETDDNRMHRDHKMSQKFDKAAHEETAHKRKHNEESLRNPGESMTSNPDESMTSNPDESMTSNPDESITSNPDESMTPNPDESMTSKPDESMTSNPDESMTSEGTANRRMQGENNSEGRSRKKPSSRHGGTKTAGITEEVERSGRRPQPKENLAETIGPDENEKARVAKVKRKELRKVTQVLYRDFSRWDTDDSGKLSVHEITHAFRVSGLSGRPAVKLFIQGLKQVHSDISRSELKRVMADQSEEEQPPIPGNDDTEDKENQRDNDETNNRDTVDSEIRNMIDSEDNSQDDDRQDNMADGKYNMTDDEKTNFADGVEVNPNGENNGEDIYNDETGGDENGEG